jgi:dTDP-4-amino-4,6-dideoxygalactose transaminase
MATTIFGDEELANLTTVVNSGSLWRGTPDNIVSQFEEAVAAHFNMRFAHAVNSGTSAEEACVAGLGVQPGDEVICPATAPIFVSFAVIAAGGVPVFADVDPATLIPSAEDIKARISDRTKALIIVHLGGQPAPMDDILAVASEHGVMVIEDCAQAFDCRYKQRQVGTFGHVSCFSLQQSKHITAGEGGFLLTNDPEIYKRAVLYSNAGMPWYGSGLTAPRPEPVAGIPTRGHFAFGHNHRMSALHGAVAMAQLKKIGQFNAKRQALVEILDAELKDCPGLVPARRPPDSEVYRWAYSIQLDPARIPLTAAEVAQRCVAIYGAGPVAYGEINYLEHVFRESERTRTTPLGIPLSRHVHYVPGSCPKAEEAAKRTLMAMFHHGSDPNVVRKFARLFRTVLEDLTSAYQRGEVA